MSDACPARFVPRSGATWRDPWPMYAALRDDAPVHHVADGDYWVLSRFADVLAAAQDTATFSSAAGLTFAYDDMERAGLRDAAPMVMLDPPEHTAFRRLVARGFTPRQVVALEPEVRAFVGARLDRILATGGEHDVVAALFKPLPSLVVAHYLGVPPPTATASTAGPRRSSRPTPPGTRSPPPRRWATCSRISPSWSRGAGSSPATTRSRSSSRRAGTIPRCR